MPAQYLRNTTAVLKSAFSAGAATGAVAVAVVGENGTSIAAGNAAQDAVPNDNTYRFAVPAAAGLNRLTATWTGTWGGNTQSIETYAEIVGAHLFTVAEARAFRDGELSSTTEYTDEAIREARDRVTDAFQNVCGVSFFPRYERETFDGTGRRRLWLPFKRPLALIEASVNGVALSAGELAAVYLYPTGRIERDLGWGTGYRNITIAWQRGYRLVPEEIKRAALALVQYELVSSEITDRMVTVANELGTVRLSVPGRNAPTGIPLIDSALMRYDERESDLIAIRG